jgi:branched-chain amino acid transport system substrate-binding protein
MMKLISAAIVMGVVSAAPAMAAGPVKIGLVTTLSGPGGYLGADIRDGFKLAIHDGKLGGVPVELLAEDDGQSPGKAKQIVQRYLTSDGVKIVTGIVYSNVTLAVVPDVLRAGAFYLSANTGPSEFAGAGCNKNYFVVGRQNDSQAHVAGIIANRLDYKSIVLLAPNYRAGHDVMAAFKKGYKGTVVKEIYTELHQTDFSAEDAEIRAAKPGAVFQFLPGGLGIAALKQYAEAGLGGTIPLMAHAIDGQTLAAVGTAALGVHTPVDWNDDFDNAANKAFVADFEKTYGRGLSYFAAYGYDTARLLASALASVGGDMDKTDAFRAALRKADFASVRGSFKFANNQHPITNWYMTDVIRGPSGKLENKTIATVLEDYHDPYGAECRM